MFRNWARHLPGHVEVCPVQLPGRDQRLCEPPLTNISAVVEGAAKELKAWIDLPFAFFGYSMGALISFELAHHFRENYQVEPVHLFVAGRPGPQIPDPNEPTYALPEPEFIDELRRLNGTPLDVIANKELMNLMIPLLRADFELCQNYHYSPKTPLHCSITAFGGLGDKSVSRASLEAWQVHTTAGFAVRMLPGDHFFVHTQEKTVLEKVSQELYRVAEMLEPPN